MVRTVEEVVAEYSKNNRVTLNHDEIKADLYKEFNPERCDHRWNIDHTEVVVTPLKWWDDASYLEYQHGDPYP